MYTCELLDGPDAGRLRYITRVPNINELVEGNKYAGKITHVVYGGRKMARIDIRRDI